MSEKKDFGRMVRKVMKVFTVSQARFITIALTLVILLVFLTTRGGRNIIEFLGYISFVGGVLFGGYKLYMYTTKNAKDAPVVKKEPEPIDDETSSKLADEVFEPFDDSPTPSDVEVKEEVEEENNQSED